MSKANVKYKEYPSFKELTSTIKGDINSLLDGDLESALENEITDFLGENEDKDITAYLGYGESGNTQICFDLKSDGSDLQSWVLGRMETEEDDED